MEIIRPGTQIPFLRHRQKAFIASVFMMAILAGFGAVLTLPGIGGIILTLGMAVDANVLINERIREEVRLGKSPRAAVDSGYERAFPAILDSNVTTFLADGIAPEGRGATRACPVRGRAYRRPLPRARFHTPGRYLLYRWGCPAPHVYGCLL